MNLINLESLEPQDPPQAQREAAPATAKEAPAPPPAPPSRVIVPAILASLIVLLGAGFLLMRRRV